MAIGLATLLGGPTVSTDLSVAVSLVKPKRRGTGSKEQMTATLQAFQEGFPSYLVWTGTSAALLFVASAVYILLTPWRELALVREGNGSAGLALAGAILGLAIPMAACLASSVSLLDLLIWGTVALLLQLITYRVIDMLLSEIPQRIQNDEAGSAIVLISAKVSVALLLAAGLWDPELQRL